MPIGLSGGAGGIPGVTVSGTPATGQALVATSSSAATWQTPVGAELDYAQITAPVTISATTEATATTIVTGNGFTADGTAAVLIHFYSPSVVVPTSAECILVLYQDGSTIGLLDDQPAGTNVANTRAASVFRRIVPASGARTFSIRAYRATSNCTVQAGAGSGAGTYQPAFIRITRAA